MDPNGELTPGEWLMKAMAPKLDERERRIRDQFVDEYLKDEDVYRAAMRLGYDSALAAEYGIKFYGESYVQQQISERRHKRPETRAEEREAAEAAKAQIRAALLREAFYHGKDSTQAARVQALKTLAAMEGMLQSAGGPPGRPGAGIPGSVSRGGVIEVPPIEPINNWEARAQASQPKLVEDAGS